MNNRLLFENVSKILEGSSYSIEKLMVHWEGGVKKDELEGNSYDFVPHLDLDGTPKAMFVRERNRILCYKLDNSCYIKLDSDPLLLIAKMKERAGVRKGRTRLTFLLVKDHQNKVVGFINHNDFNKPAMALLLWDILYYCEGIVSNYLSKVMYPSDIKSHPGFRNDQYEKDKGKRMDLAPIYYLDLRKKFDLYKLLPKPESEKLAFPQGLPALIEHFRNCIAHPGEKPKIIRKKSDISKLNYMLSLINEWLDKQAVKFYSKT